MPFKLLLLGLLAYIIISYFRRILFGINNQNSPDSGKSQKQEKEGSVTVNDKVKKKKGSINKDEGDYIDYEELDD